MTLYDVVSSGQYMQIYSIYITNTYGQNIPVSRGTLSEMLWFVAESGESLFFDHLMDKVEYFHITNKQVMVIFICDEHFEDSADYNYSKEYVARWKNLDPNTRPFLHHIETEEYTDKWLCKFPNYEAESEDKG